MSPSRRKNNHRRQKVLEIWKNSLFKKVNRPPDGSHTRPWCSQLETIDMESWFPGRGIGARAGEFCRLELVDGRPKSDRPVVLDWAAMCGAWAAPCIMEFSRESMEGCCGGCCCCCLACDCWLRNIKSSQGSDFFTLLINVFLWNWFQMFCDEDNCTTGKA